MSDANHRMASNDLGVNDESAGPLLEVEDLRIEFQTKSGAVQAVNGVDFTVEEEEILCIVGESGSGKTVSTQSIVDLVPTPPGVITGSIRYKGRELRGLPSKKLRQLRGEEIGVVFQDPMSSLNPVHTVGQQITEAINAHRNWSQSRVREHAIDLMDGVGISDAAERFDSYPTQFSGGMRQRVMIAIALANEPDLLIADEPTTALDVTIEAQVLELIRDLQDDIGMSVIWITHDLGVVAELADRVLVMYAGEIVERGTVFDLFDEPRHPYTRGLLDSIPGGGEGSTLEPIEGNPPDMRSLPTGCSFHPRCPEAMPHCSEREPPSFVVEDAAAPSDGARHTASCFLYEERPTIEEVYLDE